MVIEFPSHTGRERRDSCLRFVAKSTFNKMNKSCPRGGRKFGKQEGKWVHPVSGLQVSYGVRGFLKTT